MTRQKEDLTQRRKISMVDYYGRWTEETDYNTFPKEKWCDMDRVANYIREQGYEPKTTIENLVVMVILHFEGEVENNSMFRPAYRKNGVINLSKLTLFIETSGGLKEFDYEP